MEAIKIVEKYTDYLFNFETGTLVEGAEDGLIGFSYSTNGYDETLELNPVCLWSYDDDERVWNEDTQDYEPMDNLVIRKLKEHVKAIDEFIKVLEGKNDEIRA